MRGYNAKESNNQELLEAIREKDLVKIRSILQKTQFIDLNKVLDDTTSSGQFKSNTDLSFFEHGILSKNIEIIKLMLEYGANPNHKRTIHYVSLTPSLPIEFAIEHFHSLDKNLEIFDLLLEKTSKTLIENSQILHRATKFGKLHKEITEYYITNNISLNSVDSIGKTALDYALKNGFFKVSENLFDAGAITSPSSEDNPTPAIFYLIRYFNQNHEFLNKYLTKYPENLSAIDQITGNSLIHEAVIRKKAPALEILSQKGLKLDSLNNEGKSPALIALEKKSYNILDKLLKFGANPNTHYKNGETLLHIASKSDDHQAIKILKKYTTNQLALDCENKTAWEYGNHSNQYPNQLEIRSQKNEHQFEQLDCPKTANNKDDNSFNYIPSLPIAAFMIIILSYCLKKAYKISADHKKNDDLERSDKQTNIAI
ncbi:MAG: hypothetical protein ISQ32_00455 [Rickettsiales bacterium]|nr:hypothetical protein [Rickettsiales bacterium]